jgi:hypothetical protein
MRFMRAVKPFRLGWFILHFLAVVGTLALGNLARWP